MPFLRAALLKKKLQDETERPVVIMTPVIEEQPEPQELEEFTPVQIEDLQRLIDAKTEEAEKQEVPEAVLVVEVETVAESLPEESEVETVTQEPELPPTPEAEYVPEESQPEITTGPETQAEEAAPNTEAEYAPQESEPEIIPEPKTQEPELPPTPEAEYVPEESQPEITPEPETQAEEAAPEAETEPEIAADEITEPESEPGSETEPEAPPAPQLPPEIAEALAEPEPEPAPVSHKDYSGSKLDYDFTSGERYVDKVSTKTEFDRMLEELAAISKDLLSWEAEKFTKTYAGKFSEGDSSVAEARKLEAFLGGYITNAAMLLYDKGYRDAAIKQLEQAVSILQARKKLEDETTAIKSRVEEQNDDVDLSDILGMFGDG